MMGGKDELNHGGLSLPCERAHVHLSSTRQAARSKDQRPQKNATIEADGKPLRHELEALLLLRANAAMATAATAVMAASAAGLDKPRH